MDQLARHISSSHHLPSILHFFTSLFYLLGLKLADMLSSFTTILALAAVARAVPAAAPDFSGPPAHSVPAVRNGNFVRNGTAALLKAYAKHGLTPTREMPKEFYGLEKRQDSTALAYLADHMEYLV